MPNLKLLAKVYGADSQEFLSAYAEVNDIPLEEAVTKVKEDKTIELPPAKVIKFEGHEFEVSNEVSWTIQRAENHAKAVSGKKLVPTTSGEYVEVTDTNALQNLMHIALTGYKV